MLARAAQPPLELDREAFLAAFARVPSALSHSLAAHPLFSLEAVARLADGLPAADVERYEDGGHRNLEGMPGGREAPFLLSPGVGVYVPSFAPHWVKNGAEPSLSLSITFRSRASERREWVSELNARLRRWKLSPRPP